MLGGIFIAFASLSAIISIIKIVFCSIDSIRKQNKKEAILSIVTNLLVVAGAVISLSAFTFWPGTKTMREKIGAVTSTLVCVESTGWCAMIIGNISNYLVHRQNINFNNKNETINFVLSFIIIYTCLFFSLCIIPMGGVDSIFYTERVSETTDLQQMHIYWQMGGTIVALAVLSVACVVLKILLIDVKMSKNNGKIHLVPLICETIILICALSFIILLFVCNGKTMPKNENEQQKVVILMCLPMFIGGPLMTVGSITSYTIQNIYK
ncbi:MAG: hypothetical protein MJ200_02955 [Mycoplasmoidaceae bacterium]|nr:hypothetical protein [Mycoplasmoidaceae bacterium]